MCSGGGRIHFRPGVPGANYLTCWGSLFRWHASQSNLKDTLQVYSPGSDMLSLSLSLRTIVCNGQVVGWDDPKRLTSPINTPK
jgi:hypothetical protein